MEAYRPHFSIYGLPLEVRLEIFGFLQHADWIRLASHNHRTAKVMLENQRYLAPLPRLYSLEFSVIDKKNVEVIDITQFGYDFANGDNILSEDSEKQFVEILLAINENKCPMVVPDVPAREDEKFLYAYIKKTKEIAKELRITFQLHTKSVQELHKIRFWIQTIANTCFEKVIIRDAFHPEFLHLLFPPDTCKPIMFRADETLILEYSQLYQPLRQNIFARTLELPTKKYPSKSDFVNLILFICNTDDTRFSSISKVQIGEIMESGVDNVLVMANFQQIFETCCEQLSSNNRFPNVLVGWYESEKFENDPPIKGAKLIDETEKHATDYDSIILGKTYKYELPNSKLIPKHIFEIFLESDWEDWEDDQGGGICSFRISVKKPSV